MKINLTIDVADIDLAPLETMIARALVRTVRTLARDRLLPWVTGAPVNTPIEGLRDPDTTPAQTAPETAEVSAPTPVTEPPHVFNRHNPEPPPLPRRSEPRRHPLLDICPRVAKRPIGYVDIPTAVDAIGGGNNEKIQLYTWIKNRQINGVIVESEEPSRGLPGRLMVHRGEVLQRNQLRIFNSLAPARERKTAPRLADEQAAAAD